MITSLFSGMAIAAAALQLSPPPSAIPALRSQLEATLWRDPEAAKAEILALIARHREDEQSVVDALTSAGFEREPDAHRCRFFGYHRTVDLRGNGRSAQVALCGASREPMVLTGWLVPSDTFKKASPARARMTP